MPSRHTTSPAAARQSSSATSTRVWTSPTRISHPTTTQRNSTDCSSGTPQPLLAGNDVNGHGTHTAGTIAAAANGTGIVGVAPNVKIAGIKSSNNDGFFFPEMVICSYMWVASHGIDITNNSYFADPWLYNCKNDPEQRAIWKAERRAIKHAQQGGTLVVASQGNFSSDLSHPRFDPVSPDFPPGSEQEREITNACAVVPVEVPGVIGVTATGDLSLKSFYSDYGISTADVAAPGGDSISRSHPRHSTVGCCPPTRRRIRVCARSSTRTPARSTATCRARRWPDRTRSAWPRSS